MEARSPKSGCSAPLEGSREESVLCLFQLAVSPAFFGLCLYHTIHLHMAFSSSYPCLLFCFLYGYLSLDLGPTRVVQDDLISRYLMTSAKASQLPPNKVTVIGPVAWIYLLGGPPFSLLHCINLILCKPLEIIYFQRL